MAPKQRPGVRVDADDARRRGADPTATELVVNLMVTGALMLGRLDELLRPHGLSNGTFTLLQIVAGDPDPVTPSQIAARSNVPVTTATVTGLIDTCERRGWVERRRHLTDRRKVIVDITPAGRDLLELVDAEVARAERRWTAATTPTARRRMTDELGRLAEHLRSPAADPD